MPHPRTPRATIGPLRATTIGATLALALPVAGCATGMHQPTASGRAGETRFRQGNFVLYRYTGAAVTAPVTLKESIVSQDGNRLVIDVVAKRGSEERHWEQVVTDTPENEANNVVDELYEYVGGERRHLLNTGNRDLFRLYEWTLIVPDEPAHDKRASRTVTSFGGHSFSCEHREALTAWKGRPVHYEAYECPAFLWTHGPQRFWSDTDGDALKVEVVEFGTSL